MASYKRKLFLLYGFSLQTVRSEDPNWNCYQSCLTIHLIHAENRKIIIDGQMKK